MDWPESIRLTARESTERRKDKIKAKTKTQAAGLGRHFFSPCPIPGCTSLASGDKLASCGGIRDPGCEYLTGPMAKTIF